MPVHPIYELLGTKSKMLSGKKIVLGVTGSIAAVETVKLSHELVRHGASVYPVLTKAACDIISPEALKYASGNKPVTKITGDIEHVALCGQTKERADLLLIAPCTANTISKIACGIDDTTVTTFATTAIGSRIPVIIVPAMHSSMYDHPVIQNNIKKLEKKELNIEILKPKIAEKKHKMPSIEDVVIHVIRKLWKNDLAKKRVLIIAGSTAEAIDDMRVLTNRSSGKTGLALAQNAYLRGAETILWLGKSSITHPSYIKCESFETVKDLKNKVNNLKGQGSTAFQIIIICAAISDYTPQEAISGKLPSGKAKLELKLVPTQKIIKIARQKAPKSYLVGFKAEAKISEKELAKKATQRLMDWKLNMIVANDLAKVTNKSNQILIITRDKKQIKAIGDKEIIAERIFDVILKNY